MDIQEGLLEEDKYLLEVNFEDLGTVNGESKSRQFSGNCHKGDDGLQLTLPPRLWRCTSCPHKKTETE